MSEDTITLYPGNWLYNAGVVGFLRSINEVEGISDKYLLNDDGSVSIDKNLFTGLDVNKRYFSEEKIASLIGKTENYPNYLQPKDKDKFYFFIEKLSFVEENLFGDYCDLCGKGFRIPDSHIKYLEEKELKRFLEGIAKFDIRFSSLLGPSKGEFPNIFWGRKHTLNICHLCAFLIIHHHLAFTRIADGSEIFINTPSFKIMWYLNKYAKEIYSKEKIQTTKELLGMSLIELASKLYIQLSKWVMMNIEVVNRFKKNIDFFILPYETIFLLSDRDIASLLDNIGEFSILNLVLDGKYKEVLDMGEKILNIAFKLKTEKNQKGQKKYKKIVNELIKLEKNKENKTEFAYKLFKLYSLIEEKLKGGILV